MDPYNIVVTMTTYEIPSKDQIRSFSDNIPNVFVDEVHDMATTVNRLQLWDWFENEVPPEDKGYSWWDHPNIKKISSGLENESVHSGASFAFCMRIMQKISLVGVDYITKPPTDNNNEAKKIVKKKVADLIYDIKEKLTSEEYKNIMEALGKE